MPRVQYLPYGRRPGYYGRRPGYYGRRPGYSWFLAFWELKPGPIEKH